MAHHFDTRAAKDDPRLNICDLYVFPGAPGRTAMALTTSADVGISSPDVMHPEGLYAFRFDLDGDGREELVFTFRFGEPRHREGRGHAHVQDYDVIVGRGPRMGIDGDALLSGTTGTVSRSSDSSAFVGVVPELWAADGAAFQAALGILAAEGRFDAAAFDRRENLFRNRNVMATVLEVPDAMFRTQAVRLWATASLFGHAPEVQIARFGVPLFTHLFLSGEPGAGLAERYHASEPSSDREAFGPAVAAFVERLSGAAGSTKDAAAYGREVAARLCPSVIHYQVGAPASFEAGRMNGRPLTADAYDAMWSLAAGRPVADGVAPDLGRTTAGFPYYGMPHAQEDQSGIVPLRDLIGYAPGLRAGGEGSASR